MLIFFFETYLKLCQCVRASVHVGPTGWPQIPDCAAKTKSVIHATPWRLKFGKISHAMRSCCAAKTSRPSRDWPGKEFKSQIRPLPRRGSLVVDATGQNCQTGKGAMFARDRAPKVGSLWGNLKILRSARHRPNAPVWSDMGNIGSICGQIRPTRPQHSNFGPSWGPHGFKMVDMAGPRRNPQNTRFHLCLPLFLRIHDASCWTCLRWAQLGAKLSSKGPQAVPRWAWLAPPCV